mgnify:CR=1 FL=1
MKAVILAGGLGTRISEETHLRPKPMVEIGGKPILWHILKIYSSYEIFDFIICCGYKGYIIKEYFNNYFLHMSDVTFEMSKNEMIVHQKKAEPWKITLVDTGEYTMTGGRLLKIKEFLKDETFCFTYGDGVSDINIKSLINHHNKNKRLATITAVKPPGRYGVINLGENNSVKGFQEKIDGDGSWINGGFFVLEPETLNLIKDDETIWQYEPLNSLAKNNQLTYFKHEGFWQPMDTLRDKNNLEKMWQQNNAPWKNWN